LPPQLDLKPVTRRRAFPRVLDGWGAAPVDSIGGTAAGREDERRE
jgi:hypothetical protein